MKENPVSKQLKIHLDSITPEQFEKEWKEITDMKVQSPTINEFLDYYDHVPFTEDNIKNHFIVNPDWEKIYTSRFPNATTEEYIPNFVALMEEKGYILDISNWSKSKNPKSTFAGLRNLDLYYKFKDDLGWKFQVYQYQHYDIYRTLLIWCVCDYDIDIQTLK